MDALRTLFSSGGWTPLRFWNHILTSAKEAGLDGIEITFPPGDWHSAEAAYGSAAGFAQALTDHGLELCSGYFSNRIPGTNREADFTDPADQTDLLQMAAGYAEFLATCGADSLLVSLPLRTSRDASPPRFVDLATAAPIADTLNRMAAATLQQGVKLALHPEAFSMFRNSRRCRSLYVADRSQLCLPLPGYRTIHRGWFGPTGDHRASQRSADHHPLERCHGCGSCRCRSTRRSMTARSSGSHRWVKVVDHRAGCGCCVT
ncbi:MAG: TIM barrel protein [Caldilineaceae bacterium]